MKWLILNTDYPEFLEELYAAHPGLARRSYDEQLSVRIESLFGVADFYSSHLKALGNEARDLHVNNEPLQQAWVREHGLRIQPPSVVEQCAQAAWRSVRDVGRRLPIAGFKPMVRTVGRQFAAHPRWVYEILAAQIQYYQPDVVLNQAMDSISTTMLRDVKPSLRLLVGQLASPLPQGQDLKVYDLVISSLPNFVDQFRRMGLPSALHRFAFEPSILQRLGPTAPGPIGASFVGTLSADHPGRLELLEQLCREDLVDVWGRGVERLPAVSSVRSRHHGGAWGAAMYRILRASKITVNHHIGVAQGWANNMRLFEATGMGTLLLTDWKTNLPELFEPEREVVTYRTTEECAARIRYYLEHEEERAAIARAGQRRTISEHTYRQRVEELVRIVESCISATLVQRA